jgi:uncharacterized protein
MTFFTRREKTALAALALGGLTVLTAQAQQEIYPQHFNLEQVTLLDGPFKTAMDLNTDLLLKYDVDRLLTPFIRQAGLTTDSSSKYYNWQTSHPSFSNWGLSNWSLEGHVGGHYLTALALAYAAEHDATKKSTLKERLNYMLSVLDDCQKAFDNDTKGMKGFLGGQPINQIWTGLYSGSLTEFKKYGGWVPFYCEHKVLAGLRDAWLYADSEQAKELYKKMCDWSVDVVSNLSTSQMQDILGWEHGGMNETLADAYRLFGDKKYLEAAKKYSHQTMIDGMQTLSTTFLDSKHANTQVPKYIGFERVYQEELRDGGSTTASYQKAAHNFWDDVAGNRTVCIGGNSVSEHFLPAAKSEQYISNLDGPESCNSNNMLKLSEDLFDETHDAKYADFYEGTMWNHILSTQDPKTGGYVYFTTLRPQGYRIYSQVNQGMWCCVGTGMENHSKYGHFIYTHSDDNKTLYVNLFTASKLDDEHFALTQETEFPYAQTTKITIDKAGTYDLAIRHPQWAGEGYAIKVNGTAVETSVTVGKASYAKVSRSWNAGDVVEVTLPMQLRYETCPNYTDYVAFKYGPILLAAQTTASSEDEATKTGLAYEALQNEYGGEGRMDHAPGSMAKSLSLSTSPLLIGERADVLKRIAATDEPCHFSLDASGEQNNGRWSQLTLVPFYTIHHARYCCYWYQQTAENYAASDMGRAEAQKAALVERTLDFVAPGEQQSEAGHDVAYSSDSKTGSYQGEYYRDAKKGGYMEYSLANPSGKADSISIMCRFTTADKGRVGTITIDGKQLVSVTIPETYKTADDNGFFNIEYGIPREMLLNDDNTVKDKITFRLTASGSTMAPGLYYLRLLNKYEDKAYKFVATEWKTGDAARVAQSKISYDTEANTVTVNCGTGNNNMCLTLDWANTDYNVKGTQKYLVVRGTNLATGTGKSYLWWLNGKNRGSQVAPEVARTVGDELCVAWDITKSNLDDNCKGDLWNLSQGATIFGLTSTTGTSVISYVGFASSLDELTAINEVKAQPTAAKGEAYTLDGRLVGDKSNLRHGAYVVNHKKVVR